jgi:hypothetical protein
VRHAKGSELAFAICMSGTRTPSVYARDQCRLADRSGQDSDGPVRICDRPLRSRTPRLGADKWPVLKT